jgi:hypothetical protein
LTLSSRRLRVLKRLGRASPALKDALVVYGNKVAAAVDSE